MGGVVAMAKGTSWCRAQGTCREDSQHLVLLPGTSPWLPVTLSPGALQTVPLVLSSPAHISQDDVSRLLALLGPNLAICGVGVSDGAGDMEAQAWSCSPGQVLGWASDSWLFSWRGQM